MGLFKACDIRGVADIELTNDVVQPIAWAVGAKLAGKKVVVGGDFRLSTARLKEMMIRGMAESGCTVIDIGTVATPMFYYALKSCGAAGGVMVTASHNPPKYNGFKIVLGDMPISEAEIAEIASIAQKHMRMQAKGSILNVNIAEEYWENTVRKAKKGKLKLVLDAGNGAASDFAPELYRRCGFEVIELFCHPDGNFPNRSPNPSYPQNLKKLAAKVKEECADLGIAFDGDGDRVAFVDENGRAVDNDDILVLLAKSCLENGSGVIIYDAKCSMTVPESIKKAGGRAVMARAGHTFSKRAFLEEKALFAGEISGHFFFAELGYDDGMFAGLKMCEYVARKGNLSVLIDEIPNYILTPETRVHYAGNDRDALLLRTAENLQDHQLNLIDGIRLEFPDGWGMIRASITEPIFTLRFEAKTQERLLEIQAILIAALPECIRQNVRTEVLRMNEVKS